MARIPSAFGFRQLHMTNVTDISNRSLETRGQENHKGSPLFHFIWEVISSGVLWAPSSFSVAEKRQCLHSCRPFFQKAWHLGWIV